MPRLKKTVEEAAPEIVTEGQGQERLEDAGVPEPVAMERQVETAELPGPVEPVEGTAPAAEQVAVEPAEAVEQPKRKRGRPRKNPLPEGEAVEQPKRKRGRPRKNPLPEGEAADQPKRKRGRPRKVVPEAIAALEETLTLFTNPAAEPEAAPEAPVPPVEPVSDLAPAAEPEAPVVELDAASEPNAPAEQPAVEEMSTPEPEAAPVELSAVEEASAPEPEAAPVEQSAVEEVSVVEPEVAPAELPAVEEMSTAEPEAAPVEQSAVEEASTPEPEAVPADVPQPEAPLSEEPAPEEQEFTLKYDTSSEERYVDSTSQKTDFEKMLEELGAISKDMLSWEVEKFTQRYQGDGDEAAAKKFEAFLGGFITNAAVELYDRGYKDAAFQQLDRVKTILETKKKLEDEVESIKARNEEDVVDLSDMLGLFVGDA